MYGGAAGGGKSDALLMGALQFVDVPGYRAIIFRRTYADLALPGALMDRAHEWLASSGARWNSQSKTWTFPSGATVGFGYLDTEQTKFRYQGAEFQYIAFDELTQFEETQYRYLFSRLRRLAGVEVPLRMRAASNPGGIGHAWVRQRFLVEAEAGRRVFVPATLDDNPYLDRGEYIESLSELDPVTRQQLLEGDWDATVRGSKFHREWFEVVREAPRETLGRVRYWDMAATEPKNGSDPDWTVGTRMSVTKHGIFYIEHVVRFRKTPQKGEMLVAQTARADGRAVPIYMEREGGASGAAMIDHYRRNVLQGFEFRAHSPSGSKQVRANPLSSQAEGGNVKLVEGPWLTPWLDELELFPHGLHDDQVDSASGAYYVLAKLIRERRGESMQG